MNYICVWLVTLYYNQHCIMSSLQLSSCPSWGSTWTQSLSQCVTTPLGPLERSPCKWVSRWESRPHLLLMFCFFIPFCMWVYMFACRQTTLPLSFPQLLSKFLNFNLMNWKTYALETFSFLPYIKLVGSTGQLLSHGWLSPWHNHTAGGPFSSDM